MTNKCEHDAFETNAARAGLEANLPREEVVCSAGYNSAPGQVFATARRNRWNRGAAAPLPNLGRSRHDLRGGMQVSRGDPPQLLRGSHSWKTARPAVHQDGLSLNLRQHPLDRRERLSQICIAPQRIEPAARQFLAKGDTANPVSDE